MTKICVVHLVWIPLGLAQFAEFIASYREHEAGVEHDLLIIFKELEQEDQLAAYEELLAGINYKTMFLGSEGFDLVPYFTAAKKFDYQYFCFLNSYSVILAANWLRLMLTHLQTRGVGLVGATGSYESYYSNLLQSRPRFGVRSLPGDVRRYRHWRQMLVEAREHFEPFPNEHLRSNAFMIARELMLQINFRGEADKMESLKFESGKEGLTRQVRALDLQALVVGRDGAAYAGAEWPHSHTFRSGGQRNLLVADNRTRQYAEADAPTQKFLEQCAWGSLRSESTAARNSLRETRF
ncbi:MAG TPA: hypothetical protein VGB76_19665 [Pyrinomonadaceae bacterium]